MTISATSRYTNSQIVVGTDLDGNTAQVIVPSQQVDFTITFTYYQVNAGDTVSNLAFQFYGDSTLWWKIADANPEILLWDSLTVGSLIRVPNAA